MTWKRNLSHIVINNEMIHKFTAILGTPGNAIFPDKIEIDDVSHKVTYYKGKIIGYESMVIPSGNISSVNVDIGVVFSSVRIEAVGGRSIEISGLLRGDAKRIAALLSA